MEYKLETAKKEDGKKMLELIESTPSKGVLRLLYTRRPDAYLSYQKEDKNSVLKLVKDENGDIIFQVTAVEQPFYIEGKEKKIYYVGGLRKNPKYRQNIHWTDMFTELNKVLPNHEFYCSILNDNHHAKDVLLKKRKDWPYFHEMCTMHTNVFTTKAVLKNKWDSSIYHLERVEREQLKEVYDFLNQEGKKYNFFPVIKDFKDYYDLNIDNCFVLKKENEIIGFTALWNQESYKQYIVQEYGFPLNVLSKFHFITERMGYIPFPHKNESFPFHYLSFFYVKDFDIELYKIFLYKICKEVSGKMDSLVVGVNRENIQEEVFSSIKKLSFGSTLYYIYYGKKKKITKESFIECALL